MIDLKGLRLFMTGGTRGIGRATALALAQQGVHVAIAAKSDTESATRQGTLASVCGEIEALGVEALGLRTDVRDSDALQAAVEQAGRHWGGIDLVIHNAGAIHLGGVADTSLRQFDLMQSVNSRGLFILAQACLPWLRQSRHAHLLALSPPINLNPAWLGRFAPYTLSKYGMTLLTLGMAQEWRSLGIACNTLWPRTIIATAAISRFGGEAIFAASRTPQIMADATVSLFRQASPASGRCWLDEDLLRAGGQEDFSAYAWSDAEDAPLQLDFYVD